MSYFPLGIAADREADEYARIHREMSHSDSEFGHVAPGVALNLLRRGRLDGYQSLIDESYLDENQGLDNAEFGETKKFMSREKLMKTGRQRKKLAARTRRRIPSKKEKRRVYFCCVSSDIDIQKLYDYLVGSGGMLSGWKYQLYPGGDVLHLYKPGTSTERTKDGPIYNRGNPQSGRQRAIRVL